MLMLVATMTVAIVLRVLERILPIMFRLSL